MIFWLRLVENSSQDTLYIARYFQLRLAQNLKISLRKLLSDKSIKIALMKLVIQAGGSGTRLRPVTLETPKPLVTVKKKPIINHLVEFFGRYGVDDVIININKNHAEDYEWWQRRYKKQLPRKLKIVAEPSALGTFGGFKHLKPHLKARFVLSWGDELKDFNLTELIKAHENNPQHPVATIALVKVDDPSNYGVPIMEGNMVKEFLEKPKNPPSNFVNSGLVILEPEVFKYADFSKGFLMIEKDIYPKLAALGKLAGHKIENGRWYDCGTLERWEKAIKEW